MVLLRLRDTSHWSRETGIIDHLAHLVHSHRDVAPLVKGCALRDSYGDSNTHCDF